MCFPTKLKRPYHHKQFIKKVKCCAALRFRSKLKHTVESTWHHLNVRRDILLNFNYSSTCKCWKCYCSLYTEISNFRQLLEIICTTIFVAILFSSRSTFQMWHMFGSIPRLAFFILLLRYENLRYTHKDRQFTQHEHNLEHLYSAQTNRRNNGST